MKNYLLILFSSLLLITTNTQAEGEDKNLNIGIGTYILNLSYDDNNVDDDDFSGTALSLTYAASNQFGFKGVYYSIEHDDFSELEATGFDLSVILGTGLASQGFKAYVGAGIFNETWEFFGFEEDFSGLQITGGIGYNWDNVALDFVLGIRDPSDYEEFIENNLLISVDPTAVTGSLMLSIRI